LQQGATTEQDGKIVNKGRNCSWHGIIDASIKCEMELNQVKLFPSEVAICITHVIDAMV